MRRLFVILSVLAIIPFIATKVHAEVRDKVVSLSSGDFHSGDYYAMAETVHISGTVDGDVYAAGNTIIIDGLVTGDVLAAAESIVITGEVEQDARLLGVDTQVSGVIGRNLTIASFDITLLSGSEVSRNAQFLADKVTNNGTVMGDIQQYTSEDIPEPTQDQKDNAGDGFNVFTKVLSMASTLVLGFLLIKLFPNYTDRATNLVTTKFGKSLLLGFAGLILFPIVIIILLITIVGIPLSILVTCFFIIYLFLTRIYVMMAIGSKLNQLGKFNIKNRSYIFLLGLVLYYLLSMIPVIGGIVKLVVLIAGFGAALMNEREMYRLASKAKIF